MKESRDVGIEANIDNQSKSYYQKNCGCVTNNIQTFLHQFEHFVLEKFLLISLKVWPEGDILRMHNLTSNQERFIWPKILNLSRDVLGLSERCHI